MKIGILGTGIVGNTIGTRLIELGHEVKMGARAANNEKAAAWVSKSGEKASQGTFADAAGFGEILFNCTSGMVSIAALEAAGADNMKGKVLLDISNPLDFSNGFPPTLSVCNNDSVGEQLQKAFPDVKVVKTLNTLNCILMVNPTQLAGNHNIFVSGNDTEAKAQATDLLQSFGWKKEQIIDLGDISTSRGTEMILPLWLRLMGKLGTPMFNFHINTGA